MSYVAATFRHGYCLLFYFYIVSPTASFPFYNLYVPQLSPYLSILRFMFPKPSKNLSQLTNRRNKTYDSRLTMLQLLKFLKSFFKIFPVQCAIKFLIQTYPLSLCPLTRPCPSSFFRENIIKIFCCKII